MNRIIGIRIDKRLALNLDSPNPEGIPDDSQLIEVTASVVDENDAPQRNVTVYWDVEPTPLSLLKVYDADKNIIENLIGSGVITDAHGNAVIYIGAYNKTIFNIGVYLSGADPSQMKASITETSQTLVLCSFMENLDAYLVAPELVTNNNDGNVQIEDNHRYSALATANPYTENGGFIATWMYGREKGYQDPSIEGGILLHVDDYDSSMPINIKVPYQFMIPDGNTENLVAYLIYNDSGSISKNGSFLAAGTATAMPDLDQPAAEGYNKVYYADESVHTLTDNNFKNGTLDFIIPCYPNMSNADKIELTFYLNAWDPLNPIKKVISSTAIMGELKSGDKYIAHLSSALLKPFHANSFTQQTGIMFIRYKINDKDILVSNVTEYAIDFR